MVGIFRHHQRHVDQVLAQKPCLQFVGAQHIADGQVVGAIISEFVGALRQFPAMADDDLVRVQQT